METFLRINKNILAASILIIPILSVCLILFMQSSTAQILSGSWSRTDADEIISTLRAKFDNFSSDSEIQKKVLSSLDSDEVGVFKAIIGCDKAVELGIQTAACISARLNAEKGVGENSGMMSSGAIGLSASAVRESKYFKSCTGLGDTSPENFKCVDLTKVFLENCWLLSEFEGCHN